jgi:uncharacterized protein YndB with AHSA1/START domain
MHGTHGHYVTVDDRPALLFERLLAHPVDAVWRTVTEPAELAYWFPGGVTVDLRVGGRISVTPGDGGSSTEGEVTELDPPHVLAFSWGEERLRFELEPVVGEGCILRFTHVLSEPDRAARDAAGWHVCLDRLATRLAGEPAPPPGASPTEEWREHYEDYQERGLPSGAQIPREAPNP